jgi:hypothetical protein
MRSRPAMVVRLASLVDFGVSHLNRPISNLIGHSPISRKLVRSRCSSTHSKAEARGYHEHRSRPRCPVGLDRYTPAQRTRAMIVDAAHRRTHANGTSYVDS